MNDKKIDSAKRKERRPAENEKIRTDSKNAVLPSRRPDGKQKKKDWRDGHDHL